jgi:hypothetical protein
MAASVDIKIDVVGTTLCYRPTLHFGIGAIAISVKRYYDVEVSTAAASHR